MPKPFLAYIMPVGGGEGPDNSLPGGGGSGGYPSQPIYHPGHPDHGLPSQPGHPDQGLPGGGHRPSHPIAPGGGQPVDPDWGVDLENPDQSLPEGGEPVRPGQLPEPAPPPNLKDKIIAGLYVPGHGWTWKSYPMPEEGVDNTLPGSGSRPDHELPPTPQPKRR